MHLVPRQRTLHLVEADPGAPQVRVRPPHHGGVVPDHHAVCSRLKLFYYVGVGVGDFLIPTVGGFVDEFRAGAVELAGASPDVEVLPGASGELLRGAAAVVLEEAAASPARGRDLQVLVVVHDQHVGRGAVASSCVAAGSHQVAVFVVQVEEVLSLLVREREIREF